MRTWIDPPVGSASMPPARPNLVAEAAFAVVVLCALVGGAGAVAVDHLVRLPAAEPLEVAAVTAGLAVLVRPGVPVLVRVDARDTREMGAARDHLLDARGGQRATPLRTQPQLRLPCKPVLAPLAEVPIQRQPRLGAERHGAEAAALA